MSTWTRRSGGAGRDALTIGVLCPVVGGYYFGRLLAGISRVLRGEGHRLVAVQTYPADLDRDEFPVPPYRREAPGLDTYDGLVVVTSALADDDLHRLDATELPLVAVGVAEDLRAPTVAPDNAAGVRAAVDHLVGHGHRRIGFLGSIDQVDITERYSAFRDALAEHGLEHAPEDFLRTRDLQEASAEAVGRRAAERGLATTATIAATDRNAIGFLRGLRQAGIEVPSAHAVVGFDNSDSGARIWPRMTSVDVLHDAVGERAAELVLAQVRGDRVTGRHRLDQAALIMRESCGCAQGTRSTVVGGTPSPADPDTLGAIARVIFTRADAVHRQSGPDAWLATVRQLVESAVATGGAPPEAALRALGDRTAALRPGPGALEQIVPAVHAEARRVRDRLAGRSSSGSAARPRGLDPEAADDVATALERIVVALVRGCGHGDLARAGRLEQDLTDQNQVDLDLMRSGGEALRRLDWMPRSRTHSAALALWEDDPDHPGGRRLRVVGARGPHPSSDHLVGRTMPASEFPPPELTDTRTLTVVVPVAFGRSDRGLLAVGGLVDTRATSTRARYNHWAAMLAVALDAEESLCALQHQRRELAEAADRERALAHDASAGEERAALVSIAAHDGTWDWDVSTGTVRYSEAWARLVGQDGATLGDDPQEWFSRVHPQDVTRVHAAVAAQLSGAHEPLDVEHRVRVADGRYVRVRCRAVTVHDAGDRPARLVGSMAAVDRTPASTGPVPEAPAVDVETGLVSRELFVDLLDRAIRRRRRVPAYSWQVLAVAFPGEPAVSALHDVLGELEVDDCAAALGPRTVAVLLDGRDDHDAEQLAARLGHVLGRAATVRTVPVTDPEPTSADVVVRRTTDALGDPFELRRHPGRLITGLRR